MSSSSLKIASTPSSAELDRTPTKVFRPLRVLQSPRARRGGSLEKAFHSFVELVQLLRQDRLDDLEVDSEVLVSDQISESHDPYPGNLRSRVACLLGELRGRFADDNAVVQDGVARLSVELAGSDVVPDRLDRIGDVPKPQFLAAAQSGTASASASARTSGRSDRGVTTSTRAPRSLVNNSESSRASKSSAPEERSPCSSTIRSISLLDSSSPRAIEPKTRTFSIPRAPRSSRIASRCERNNSDREPMVR
jgi:hypothetical protein